MSFGTRAVDFEERVNFDRLRQERLKRAKEYLKKSNLGALLCFDFNNTRYIIGTWIGEWARDKMTRYCILPRDAEPILFDVGSAVVVRKQKAPWIKDVRPAISWGRGAVPKETMAVKRFVEMLKQILIEYGVADLPLGIDILDVPLLKELQIARIEIADGQEVMLNARLIKTRDEIELLKIAAAMADAAFDMVIQNMRPGWKDSDVVALINNVLYTLGSDHVECVNVLSGPRTNPHHHDFSDRIIRPGDIVFIGIMHSYNRYRTCYYRTFCVGKPTIPTTML